MVCKHMCLYRKYSACEPNRIVHELNQIINVQCSFYHPFFDLSFQGYFTLLMMDVIISSISQDCASAELLYQTTNYRVEHYQELPDGTWQWSTPTGKLNWWDVSRALLGGTHTCLFELAVLVWVYLATLMKSHPSHSGTISLIIAKELCNFL